MKGGESKLSNSDSAFLPADYEEPVTSQYLKFEEGSNQFRVLPAKPGKQTLIMGWEYWKTVDGKRKPIRVTKDVTVSVQDMEINPKTGELDTPKFFWIMAVWNYKTKSIQILEVKQKTIRQAMESLARNPKWGSPVNYDLIVNQVVESGKTSYTTAPDPKEEIDPKILEEYEATFVNLEALYDGGDPFSLEHKEILDPKEVEQSFGIDGSEDVDDVPIP